MFQKIQKLIQKLKEKGQGAVEYALLLGFVAIIVAYFTMTNGTQDAAGNAVKNMNEQATLVTAAYNKTPS